MLGFPQRQKGGVEMQYENNVKMTMGMVLVVTLLLGGAFMLPLERALAAQPKATLQLQDQSPMSMVNINKATAEELDAIRGVGPVLADRIVKFREQSGGFKTVDDLAKVRGLSGAKFQKIKAQVTV